MEPELALRALRSREDEGCSPVYVFFPDSGSFADPPTASSLSQWATTPFERGGLAFRSAEQAMMFGKARLFGDASMGERILACRTAFQARHLGSQVAGFRQDVWERERFEVVVEANRGKFAGIPALRTFLLSTGEAALAEASPTDPVWGIGLDESDPRSRDARRWPGLNLLGFALMAVRDELVAGAL